AVGAAIRDRMAEIAPVLEHVEKIETVARADRADGSVARVNAWRGNPALPPALSQIVTREQMGWLDHAEWSADLAHCRWRIQTNFMSEAIDCAGTTRLEPAMGGRGSRAIFEG